MTLGVYPFMNGQLYGGGEASEEGSDAGRVESGNMIPMFRCAGACREQRGIRNIPLPRC